MLQRLDRWLQHSLQQEEFALAEALERALLVDPADASRSLKTRVGMALQKLGCERIEHRLESPRHVYKRPQRNAASSPADSWLEF